jgi:hypothetical protein
LKLEELLVLGRGSRLGRPRIGTESLRWAWGRRGRAIRSLFGASLPRDHLVSDDLNTVKHEQVRAIDTVLVDDVIPSKKLTVSVRSDHERREKTYIFIEPRIATMVPSGIADLYWVGWTRRPLASKTGGTIISKRQ